MLLWSLNTRGRTAKGLKRQGSVKLLATGNAETRNGKGSSGRLFVNLVIHADESGTHDQTGALKGAREAVMAGIVAPREEWASFCPRWQAVLNKYGAPYFHFCEWSDACSVAREKRRPTSTFKNNPYRDWKHEKLNRFLIELATLAGSGNKMLIINGVFTNVFHQEKLAGNLPENLNPYEHCADQFFARVVGAIEVQRAPWKRLPISFFFDQSDDHEWTSAIARMFHVHQKQRRVFREIAFADKKLAPHLPLQAADMVAYRARQMTEKWVDENYPRVWPELDSALFKSTFDFLDTKQEHVFRAFLRGEFDHH